MVVAMEMARPTLGCGPWFEQRRRIVSIAEMILRGEADPTMFASVDPEVRLAALRKFAENKPNEMVRLVWLVDLLSDFNAKLSTSLSAGRCPMGDSCSGRHPVMVESVRSLLDEASGYLRQVARGRNWVSAAEAAQLASELLSITRAPAPVG